mmetsp:Transcript_2762/g.7910  ORF Transcript_2762/g.7910 Transcript_2762/m.7910 type:complete len:328 (-) Transcript_2762:124-1107(-)
MSTAPIIQKIRAYHQPPRGFDRLCVLGQIGHWQRRAGQVVVGVQRVQRLLALALRRLRICDKGDLEHVRYRIWAARDVVHMAVVVAVDVHHAEARLQECLHRCVILLVIRCLVEPMELQDHLPELLQYVGTLGGEDRPLSSLNVHLHDQAAIGNARQAGVAQDLPHVPEARLRWSILRRDADPVKLAARARLPAEHGAIELVHHRFAIAAMKQVGHVARPLVMLLHTHGVCDRDPAMLPTIHACQVPSVVGFAQALEVVARGADTERRQKMPRRRVQGGVLAQAIKTRGDVRRPCDQGLDLLLGCVRSEIPAGHLDCTRRLQTCGSE